MEVADLFSGIAVLIDDQIGEKEANISDVVRQIEEKKMPCVFYKELPDVNAICHFTGVSFLILDWKLPEKDLGDSIADGVKIPDLLSEANETKNIEFLNMLRKSCFAPIFIFTNEGKERVIAKLKEHGLYQDGRPNVIFVKNKDELKGDNKLFSEIEKWVKVTPSIYVLKEWEREYQNAKNRLFLDFYERSPFWPNVLWGCYKDDGADIMSRELGEIITRNLYTRMAPLSFDSEILEIAATSTRSEIRCVLEGERFIKFEQLNENEIFTGDIFREEYKINEETKYRYWLNIRAQCDLVRNSNPNLYCLKGRVINEDEINTGEGIIFNNGEFREKKTNAIVPCIDNGKIIEFLFQGFEIKKWNSLKDKRIGRLLPPYINRIQQQYALFFQRLGLPRTPEEAFVTLRGSAEGEENEGNV